MEASYRSYSPHLLDAKDLHIGYMSSDIQTLLMLQLVDTVEPLPLCITNDGCYRHARMRNLHLLSLESQFNLV